MIKSLNLPNKVYFLFFIHFPKSILEKESSAVDYNHERRYAPLKEIAQRREGR